MRDDRKLDSDSSLYARDLLSRRTWLKTLGTTTAALTTLAGGTPTVAADEGASTHDDWRLVFEDQFEGSTLDSNNWSTGFGWGYEADNDIATATDENVYVDDGVLRLLTTHNGGGETDVYQGAINSRTLQAFGPGHYFEARMRMPGRTGILPAFWGKPNSEAWPPEIDFVELFQEGTDPTAEQHRAHVQVHYNDPAEPGNEAGHRQAGLGYYDSGTNLTEEFHTYGCAWLETGIRFYVNGTLVDSIADDTVMTAVNGDTPFYLMFSNHVNRIGAADLSNAWEEETAVEWCRVWEHPEATDRGVPKDTDGEP